MQVANSTPESVAPKVFAIVFSDKIAELVLSISRTKRSSISPLRLERFLSCSISEGLVLSTIASKSEQKAETASVKNTVRKKYAIYIKTNLAILRNMRRLRNNFLPE